MGKIPDQMCNREERYACEAHKRAVRDYNQAIYEAKQCGYEEGIKMETEKLRHTL